MKVLGPRFAAVGLIVCLETMTSACGARSAPAGTPVPPQTDQSPQAPAPATAPPEPTSPTPEPPASLPPAAPPPAETSPPECGLIAQPGESIATVALADAIDPSNAPHPSNESERLLFRQLYETLIRVDCDGHARPGLAAAWRLDTDARSWIVTLRDNARFSDGTPVTADEVRASWTAGGDELQPHVTRLVESIVPLDDRRVAITLRSQRIDVPLALAHTDLAIARHTGGSRWPLGTRIDGAAPQHDAALSHAVITVERDDLSSTRFLLAPADPRDLLDSGVDLMLTREPAALAYAATLPHFQSVALPWQRMHVLIAPGRTRTAPLLSDDRRQVLADDAVRGEARGAAGPFWWQTLQDCAVSEAEPRQLSASARRIVYDAHDSVARDLAERFVGLARDSGTAATGILEVLLPGRPRVTFERAVGLSGEPLARTRRLGRDAAYIFSLDVRPLDPCRDMHFVRDVTPWLDPQTIVPLVETRLRAIVRRGRSGVTAEWDGGLLIAGAAGRDK